MGHQAPVRVNSAMGIAAHCLSVLAALLYWHPVWADPHSFNIPAGEAATELRDFAKQSGLQLLFDYTAVKAIKTRAISGQYEPEAALKEMLRGTGLEFERVNSHTVAIRQAAPATTNAGTARSAVAEPTAHPPAGRATGVEPTNNLEEIVVTAQKREETLARVPISVSVLSGAALDKSTLSGVSDALNTVPGVATQQNYLGGGTVVVIRGVAPSFPAANGSSPVAYYLDSVPFGLVRSAIGADQDVFDLARVEVLRGPQGTLYGASALNGVVRVLTNDADLTQFDFKARVSDSGTQYGGNNYRGDVAVNVPLIDDKLAIRAVVGYQSNSGWIDQTNKNNTNDSQLKNYRVKINAQPTPDLSIGLSAWSSRESASAPSIGYASDKSSAQLDQPLFTDFDAYSLKVGYQLPWFSITSATSYLDYSNAGSLDLIPFGIPGSIFFSGLTSNVFSEEMNLTSTQDGPWHWSAGAIYRRATENNLQTFTLIGVPPELVELTSKSYAVYGELTRKLLEDRLELTTGLRHFHDDISQVGQFGDGTPPIPAASTAEANTPRVVATWHQTDHVMLYASYSQGFRSGFPQDISVTAGFPGVQPDRLRNYELGSKGTIWDGLLTYDASLYYMKWSGIQQSLTVPYLNVTTQAVVNGQGASGIGSDLAVVLQPIQDLKIQANVSWNNLQFDSDVISGGLLLFHKGDRTTSSPEVTAGLSADYGFALGTSGYRGSFSVAGNYISPQAYRGFVGPTLTDLEVDTGDPIVLARVGFSVDTPDHWKATLYVDNVNNERGAPVKAFVGVPDWDARVRPRTFGLQLDYHLH